MANTFSRYLHFYGIQEEGEQEDSFSVPTSFLGSNKIEVDISDVEFQRVHRVGKVNEDVRPRPITARFLCHDDRRFMNFF